MKFDDGFVMNSSSVSSRLYRKAACAHLEKLVRHLRETFPRNFAGVHVSGQNSGEWFYEKSQSASLGGYEEPVRDAFRAWLAKEGEPDAATAEVPSPEARRDMSGGCLLDPVRHRRVVAFNRFRQEEMASFLSELGAAVRRGSDGESLAMFFYGYSWELGGVSTGAAATGHYALEWLIEHGRENVDALSAPYSYSNRRWPGSIPVMSAAETLARAGILWFNEDDTRTYREDIWDYKAVAGSGATGGWISSDAAGTTTPNSGNCARNWRRWKRRCSGGRSPIRPKSRISWTSGAFCTSPAALRARWDRS